MNSNKNKFISSFIYTPTVSWFKAVNQLFKEPYKWILHPSAWRLRWLSLLLFLGNIVFYFVWELIIKQPFESFYIRMFLSLLGAIVFVNTPKILNGAQFWKYLYSLIIFIQLPLFFLFMCYMNNFNLVWQGSCVAMVLIYYQGTDWRLASASILVSLLILIGLQTINPSMATNYEMTIFSVIFIFAWVCAILAGGSTANLLKQYFLNTAFNLGVMAHELRTPISSINILNHLVKRIAIDKNDSDLLDLSNKLFILIKTINLQIDHQIANSKTNFDNVELEICSSKYLIELIQNNYPFKSTFEANAIKITYIENFEFIGNNALFKQVIYNLLKNSFKAMYTKELQESDMSINFFIDTSLINNKLYGIITIHDNGVGIKSSDLQRVTEPFVSSAGPLGHGLGLPFCKNVLELFNGRLRINSTVGEGTTIQLEVPIHKS